MAAVREALNRVSLPLAAFFGQGYSDTPGMRLAVAGDFVTRTSELSDKFAGPGADEVSIAIECVAVPASQADRFPQVEVEYQEMGKAPRSERWLPGESKRFAFTFVPGRGDHFVIRMCNEKNNATKGFIALATPDCVVAALAGALGASADSLDFEGTGEFRGDHAKFRLMSANGERIRRLASGTQNDAKARLPERCVEIRAR